MDTNNNDFIIRLDFKSIEESIFRLYKLGETFRDNRFHWTHYKHNEDFNEIYSLERKYSRIFSELYAQGARCAHRYYDMLTNINSIHYYPDLSSFVSIKDSVKHDVTTIEKIIDLTEKIYKTDDVEFYSVSSMLALNYKQLNMLKTILRTIRIIENSKLFQEEQGVFSTDSDLTNITNITIDGNHNNVATQDSSIVISKTPKQIWWLISLVVSFIGGGSSWLLINSWKLGIVIAIISFGIMMIFDPKRRYFRAALVALLTAGLHFSTFTGLFEVPKNDFIHGFIRIGESSITWIGIIFILLAIYLFKLDYEESRDNN